MTNWKIILVVLLTTFGLHWQRSQGQAANRWLVVDIGLIGAGSEDILSSAMKKVERESMTGMVIQLDTPGGTLVATRAMVKKILSAPFPVAVWVGPDGARAASAGAFITLSGHVAGMAPGTNIGAAKPIQSSGQNIEQSDAKEKIENDTLAFMESIADARNRNKDMALSFVENSISITAEEALENKVIDLIVPSVAELLKQMDGKEIALSEDMGETTILDTQSFVIVNYEKGFREQILEIVSNPNIFYLLFVAGIIGIGFEMTNPGVFVPGVIGAICIILALIASSTLPVNFGSMLLIGVSIAFMVAEIFIPSFGILGIGGFIAFVVGSLFLIDGSNELGLSISPLSIIPGAIAVGGFGGFVGYLVLKSERRPSDSGVGAMIGEEAEVIKDFVEGKGKIRVNGEIWDAVSESGDLSTDDKVEIIAVEGLILSVRTR